MALFGSLSTVRAQLAPSDKFATAFAYVEACLRAGSPERALLDGLAAEQTQRVDLGATITGRVQAVLLPRLLDWLSDSPMGCWTALELVSELVSELVCWWSAPSRLARPGKLLQLLALGFRKRCAAHWHLW